MLIKLTYFLIIIKQFLINYIRFFLIKMLIMLINFISLIIKIP